MRNLLALSALALAASTLTAQSPLTTLYAGGNGLGAASTIYFDLVVNAPLLVSQIDVNLSSAASTVGSIEVRLCPTTYVGNDTNAGAWTLVSTGAVTSLGGGIASSAAVTPFPLAPGNHGVAITYVGVGQNYTDGNGTTTPGSGTNQTYSTAELTLLAGASSAGAPGTAICCQPRVFNGAIHYTVSGSGTVATRTLYGEGCVSRFGSFYELFPNGTFDLSNTSLSMIYTGTGYAVLPIGTGWFTPVSTPITLTDDSVSPAQNLGFSLPFPGGSTSDVYISSNGFVWAQSSTNNGCCAGLPSGLLTLGARWCPNWGDLNPGVGGTVHFDTDPANGAAYVTFVNVPEFGVAANTNTFQVAFFSTGVVEFRYQSCLQSNRNVLVGWSPGAANLDPGSIDLSAALPVNTQSPDVRPLALTTSARPVTGTSINLITSNIQPSAAFGAVLLSFQQLNIPLASIGMDGCTQLTGGDATLLFVPGGQTSAVVPFAVPNFVGFTVYGQSVVLDPASGLTSLGAVASNGVQLFFGNL
jgi:hypothetical protein